MIGQCPHTFQLPTTFGFWGKCARTPFAPVASRELGVDNSSDVGSWHLVNNFECTAMQKAPGADSRDPKEMTTSPKNGQQFQLFRPGESRFDLGQRLLSQKA